MPNEDYDAYIEALLADLRKDLLQTRPEDPHEFIIEKISKVPLVNKLSPVQCDTIIAHYPSHIAKVPLTITIFGASGDLARKKTFPALFVLYCEGLLPIQQMTDSGCLVQDKPHNNVLIIGYARTNFKSDADFHKTLRPYLSKKPSVQCHVDEFLSCVTYICGSSYSDPNDFSRLNKRILMHERSVSELSDSLPRQSGNRLFYLALPPDIFLQTLRAIKQNLCDQGQLEKTETSHQPNSHTANAIENKNMYFSRFIIEKPFGHDSLSSSELSYAIKQIFEERQIYRIDHYLGKEMVQNFISLRFANHIFSSLWSYRHIQSVTISFKEIIGTEGRGGYFDKFGIIRDIVQNHLTQILALVCMEKPASLGPEAVRDQKVALLRSVQPVSLKECVIGQYTASPDGSILGYLDDPTVPPNSKCPTFATMVLHIYNDRWLGVPIIIKAGKAMNSKSVKIRVQFRDEIHPFLTNYFNDTEFIKKSSFCNKQESMPLNRNELVIVAQPNESIYVKINTKTPGLNIGKKNLLTTELNLTYGKRFGVTLPDAYESLINEAILGNSTNFVRNDELEAAWAIYTPLLHAIDKGKVPVIPYQAGSNGPKEAEDLILSTGYCPSQEYRYIAS